MPAPDPPQPIASPGYLWIASGYLVDDGCVLLVHHPAFEKWVPPGGHLEPGETFSEAAAREFLEETGLVVDVLSAGPAIHPPDANATPEPLPFYVDVEREGFARPALVQYFFVERARSPGASSHGAERRGSLVSQWFTDDDISNLTTFAQVRSLARYALNYHPIAGRIRPTPPRHERA